MSDPIRRRPALLALPAPGACVAHACGYLLLALLAISTSACRAGGSGDAVEHSAFLDGRPTSFLIVGYSTSFAWPDMLQDMLDQHAGGDGTYHVLNATAGGAAVEIWLAEPGTEDHERTLAAMLRDYFGPGARLRGDAPEPSVALCQQSLQFTRDRRGPVKSESDTVGIKIGADALWRLAVLLREAGVERVVYGMHIYKEPVEPEVGNERIALAHLLARGHDFIQEGPDVWTPTRNLYPECFDEDGVHPNELGMKIMAEGWYRTLAGPEVEEDIVARLYLRDYDVPAMMRAYLDSRRAE